MFAFIKHFEALGSLVTSHFRRLWLSHYCHCKSEWTWRVFHDWSTLDLACWPLLARWASGSNHVLELSRRACNVESNSELHHKLHTSFLGTESCPQDAKPKEVTFYGEQKVALNSNKVHSLSHICLTTPHTISK